MSMTGKQCRALIASDQDAGDIHDDHWTPEYRAWVKQQADRQWEIISRKYHATRNPLASMSDERRAELEKEWQS